MLELATLRVIWWLLLGVLFTGFAVMDGFDLGTAILLPFLAKNENEREEVLNIIRPVWEGNQVWLILSAGAIFAAWPNVYGAVFSGAYFLILLLLLTIGISRPVSFKYRTKLPNLLWRRSWDWVTFIGGLCPAFILGVLVGNVLTGMPFILDNTLRLSYKGSFLQLFPSFSLLCGLISVSMFAMHGGIYTAIKTKASIQQRALFWVKIGAFITLCGFLLGGLEMTYLPGYHLMSVIDKNGDSNPLFKIVKIYPGAWLENYIAYPFALAFPAAAIAGLIGVLFLTKYNRIAFLFSSLSIAALIGTIGATMFPFILPSSIHPASSLLVWDSSSSQLTLLIMLGAVIIFLPIVLFYTSWVYHVLRR